MNPTIDEYGNKYWRNDKGELHREDGPAIEYKYGTKYWYINDNLHRLDGSAIEWFDGMKEWYIDGEKIDCKDNEDFLRIVKMKELL
jgi:hypothetical protein